MGEPATKGEREMERRFAMIEEDNRREAAWKSLAVRSDGSLVAWGGRATDEFAVPADVTNAVVVPAQTRKTSGPA